MCAFLCWCPGSTPDRREAVGQSPVPFEGTIFPLDTVFASRQSSDACRDPHTCSLERDATLALHGIALQEPRRAWQLGSCLWSLQLVDGDDLDG